MAPARLARLVNHVDHVFLASHRIQESHAVLVVLVVPVIPVVPVVLLLQTILVIQAVLDIFNLLAGRVFQDYHELLASPLVQQDQLPLVVQDELGPLRDLVGLGYLVLPVLKYF